MAETVAVIIPTRNDERTVEQAITSARAAGAAEVIVSDGGSTDGTIERASRAGALIVDSERVRGAQLNRAAESSRSDILLFLHADSELPQDALNHVIAAIHGGFVFGGFRIRFAERHPLLRVAAGLINLRSRITRCPWGDQAQFIRRELFLASGGYKVYPLMEDYEMAIRMKRRGAISIVRSYVTTSGRRFLEKGFLATPLTNWKTIVSFRLGTDPFALEKQYRK